MLELYNFYKKWLDALQLSFKKWTVCEQNCIFKVQSCWSYFLEIAHHFPSYFEKNQGLISRKLVTLKVKSEVCSYFSRAFGQVAKLL